MWLSVHVLISFVKWVQRSYRNNPYNVDRSREISSAILNNMRVNAFKHYSDVIMSTMSYQITSLPIVYSIVYSGVDQRKHQSSASLVFVRGIHRWPVNSPHKGPVTRKMLPFDDVMNKRSCEQIKVNLVSYAINVFKTYDAEARLFIGKVA